MAYYTSSAGLTWHKGAIPSHEIWVKLGGDKGHGSFKFNLQLVNTATPNSMKNTSLLEGTLKKQFDYTKGVLFSTLDKSLQQLHVQRQAYQGGTFVGNHVHKLLQVTAIIFLNLP